MIPTSLQKRNAYLVIGAIGVFFSVGYLGMSFQLPFGQMNYPGAGLYPAIVGFTMIMASLITMWEGWKMDKAVQIDLPDGMNRKRLLSLIGLLLGYILILPWLGQIIVSLLFCVLLMHLLSDLSWLRILLYSLVISIVLYVVFVILLKVPMPRGVLRLIF